MLILQFLIHELAKRAETTVRTIRYYTDEGLLPQPVVQGKYAYYTEAHLKRLKLIQRLKDAYLPLREIREIMNSLTDEEVERRLAEPSLFPPKESLSRAPDQQGADALQYISRLMQEQDGHRSRVAVHTALPSSDEKNGQLVPVMPEISGNPALPTNTESWQRITLAPGVELHIRGSIDAQTSWRMQKMIDLALALFSSTNR